MEKGLCGADCDNCGLYRNKECKGYIVSDGCPFGQKCFLAAAVRFGGCGALAALIRKLLGEINLLAVPGLPVITEFVPLNGFYVNPAYDLPGGKRVKFLEDRAIYLGTSTL